ncbi:citrate lyase subunit beta/citryl-CoA lyase [Methylobacterium sp. BE186]|uniref:aldolase/citrate lyase family protein n=1 Tax=Methylobacterium sp. BE186 TaxID=2817715 RepID=UPI002865E59F|nr:aldolase/citrate lyase family protein [Methylobacterium sp. BE186]MDR7039142.1 citrate lyase subunit beta/citryl-CoA lyase [Methylobacterium sp. BE186]
MSIRSLIVVTCGRPDGVAAVLAAGADACVLDLGTESGGARNAARAAAAEPLACGRADRAATRLFVGIGRLDAGKTDADLAALMGFAPDGIVLATGSGRDVAALGARLAVHEALAGLPDGSTRILAAAHTAADILALPSLPGASGRLAGLTWDVGALAADLRVDVFGTGSADWPSPCRHARDRLLITATAAGLPAFDTAEPHFADRGGAECAARAAARDGFSGKLAVDPAHVPAINTAFGRLAQPPD